MRIILHIETAVEGASFCITADGKIIVLEENKVIRDSASWLHAALQQSLNKNDLSLGQLSAIAVSAGPGPYTGLRVGLSAAKGLCYALGIPLIKLGTLEIMAVAAADSTSALLCPMIDARRMEVYTAVFDRQGNTVLPPQNMILDANSFGSLLAEHSITFFGNGSIKLQPLLQHHHASFSRVSFSAAHMVFLADAAFEKKHFTDLAYSEPYYIKDFFTPQFPQSIQ